MEPSSSSLKNWTQAIYALHAFSRLTGIFGAATVVVPSSLAGRRSSPSLPYVGPDCALSFVGALLLNRLYTSRRTDMQTRSLIPC